MNGATQGTASRKNSLAIIINGNANLTKKNNVVKVAPAANDNHHSSVVIKDVTPPTPVFIP